MSQVEDVYPLTPMQEGMLFHSLYAPGSGVYVTQVSLALPENVLDAADFERGWRHVLARHAALRTFFLWEGLESPVQAVAPEVDLPFEQQDWRGLAAADVQDRLAAFLRAERLRGFNLAAAPLLRLALLRLPNRLCQLVWTFHHLILDGWSVSIVLKEVRTVYEDLRRGREPRLPAVRPYRDYLLWLERQDLAQAEEHWRRALGGFTSPTPLPADPEAEGRAGYGGDRRLLSAAETAELAGFARRAGLTLNTLVQAAWALLLSRYSGHADVAFGAAVLGRPADLPGAESMVGLFINTLVLRVEVLPDAPLGAWLQELQASWARSRRFEHSPLVQVQGWSEVPRGIPLFESVLSIGGNPGQPAPGARATAAAAASQAWEVETTDQTNVALNLEVALGSELMLELRYDGSRFGEGFARRLLGHLATLFAALPGNRGRRLSDLPLLTAAERAEILDDWNRTEVPLPAVEHAHQLFERQAALTPEAVALSCAAGEVLYGELNRRANAAAAALIARGIAADDVVPLLAPRGIDLTVAILGIWKAGGAFLPLDPRQPADRLRRVLATSGARLAVVADGLRPLFEQGVEGLPPAEQPAPLRLAELAAGREDLGNPPLRSGPANLAYVIYTSGSTGVPKGAMVAHRGMLNHLLAKVRALGLDRAACVAQTAALSFDIAVWQLMAALLAGGRVRVVGDAAAADPRQLLAEVEGAGVTVLETVPSMLRALLERLEGTARRPPLSALAWHLVTGEALPPEACRRWLLLYPRTPLLNAYGPTECADDVTHAVIAAPPPLRDERVPIGRAVDNTRLYVLDAGWKPLPVGVPGELYAGGLGVGRGYRGDPAKTAERFLPDPFSAQPGERLYRTGDLVRYRSGGALELLDRIGRQVKIRGFRIELGEVEAAFAGLPGIKEAAVLAREDTPGDRRLVAYVVPAAGAEIDLAELRELLARRLPDYMLPAALVLLPALPLSANGKLDRKALPAPDASRREAGEPELVPPRDELEAGLVEIWEEVLAVRPIGVKDNFFRLGGHSLLAIRLMGMIAKWFDQELPLALLVEGGTVEHLAAAMGERRRRAAPLAVSPVVRLQSAGAETPFFCIHPIGGQVLCYVDLARHLGTDRPFYGIQAPRLDEVGERAPDVEDMAAGYLAAVREVQAVGPYLLGGWSMGGLLAFEMARQLAAGGERAALVAILDAWSPDIHRIVPDDAYLLYEIVKDQARQKGITAIFSYEQLAALDPEVRLQRVLAQGRRAGLVSADVDVSWLRRFLKGYRARREALQRYRPSPYPGPLTLFRVAGEDAGFLAVLESHLGIDVSDPTLGWGAYSASPVAVEIAAGNHSTMCLEPHARTLAQSLRAWCERSKNGAEWRAAGLPARQGSRPASISLRGNRL